MNKKIYIIIVIFIVFLIGLFLLLRSDDNGDFPIDPVEVGIVISEERRMELEEMKDKEFYEDEFLNHLGWVKDELTTKHGSPDSKKEHYLGGHELYYEDMNATFVFFGDEGVVNNIYLHPGAEFMGTKVGMTFDEIENILGEPVNRGFDEHAREYTMYYSLGDSTEYGGELEVWISTEEEDGPTDQFSLLWKKYHENR